MLLFFSLVSLILLLLFPDICLAGAKDGLLIWFETILPTLFPFMVLSLFMVQTKISEKISSFFPAALRKLLGISPMGAYPVLIGMLSGFPVGASVTVTLLKEGKLSFKESSYLICLCNNISPMFLLSFIGGHCLGLGWQRYLLIPILHLSAFASARLISPPTWTKRSSALSSIHPLHSEDKPNDIPSSQKEKDSVTPASHTATSLITACNTSIMSALHTLAFVGGYMMLFSLISRLLLTLSPHPVTNIVAALLEISTGSSYLAKSCALPYTHKIILLGALSSFGGLSSIAQTSSVITEAGFSIIRYSVSKLLQAVITGVLCILFFLVIGNIR